MSASTGTTIAGTPARDHPQDAADPARCLVVDDSPAGVAVGKAAGCAVYAVSTTHPPAALAAADRCYGSLLAAAGDIVAWSSRQLAEAGPHDQARWRELRTRYSQELRAFRASDDREVERIIREYGPAARDVVEGGQ
jgi:hypothetical protein